MNLGIFALGWVISIHLSSVCLSYVGRLLGGLLVGLEVKIIMCLYVTLEVHTIKGIYCDTS